MHNRSVNFVHFNEQFGQCEENKKKCNKLYRYSHIFSFTLTKFVIRDLQNGAYIHVQDITRIFFWIKIMILFNHAWSIQYFLKNSHMYIFFQIIFKNKQVQSRSNISQQPENQTLNFYSTLDAKLLLKTYKITNFQYTLAKSKVWSSFLLFKFIK